jgi:hypothetical protein
MDIQLLSFLAWILAEDELSVSFTVRPGRRTDYLLVDVEKVAE